MNVTGFIPYLLSLAGLAVLSSGGSAEDAATRPLPTAPVEMSSELSGVAAIPSTPTTIIPATPAAAAAAAPDRRPIDVQNLRITHELPVQQWLHPGEYAWDDEAAASARGETIVVVNLRSRTLSAYKGGVEIGRSSILYGFDGHETPLGTFPVLAKAREHYSRTYGNAPMPHMLRLTRDGVALHGSARLADDAATHGCVGLPEEFAALLFDHVGVGDRVVIWSGRAS